MATSESDDFESADEELAHNVTSKSHVNNMKWSTVQPVVDSESDDDTEFIPHIPRRSMVIYEKPRYRSYRRETSSDENKLGNIKETNTKMSNDKETKETIAFVEKMQDNASSVSNTITETAVVKDDTSEIAIVKDNKSETEIVQDNTSKTEIVKDSISETAIVKDSSTSETSVTLKDNPTNVIRRSTKNNSKEEKLLRPRKKTDGPKKFGARKLETKIKDTTDNIQESILSTNVISTESIKEIDDISNKSSGIDLPEVDMPEELKSNKKFREIFKPQGWEKIGNNIKLEEDLTEKKIQPVLDKLSIDDKDTENSLWSNWGNWGVSSLINTASAGVSTLTCHVTQGLSLLEETINATDIIESHMIENTQEDKDKSKVKDKDNEVVLTSEKDSKENNNASNQSQGTFGLSSFLDGVSSITKLVESTGSKVMTSGLDTLEAIGKKTMEVLQEGDPGLKKKKAFFMVEGNKPNLSQILREVKEKAESEEKTIEEKQLARKIHFESLFDDYQGLVHLEALEMLSKQCNIKIQSYLVNLDAEELVSLQETLEEVKELCDLEDIDDVPQKTKDLKSRLADACQNLEITITYEQLDDVLNEAKSSTYLASPMSHTHLEIFQYAISIIAKFTAVSVERFHKTAELLLIKERRSTASEADALINLTHILTAEINSLAANFCSVLKEFIQMTNNSDTINANMTTIFFETNNASSYIEEAFKLLIPILQVGTLWKI